MKHAFLSMLVFSVFFLQSCNETQFLPEGKLLYEKHCSSCHGKNGEGLESLIPQLKDSDMLINAGSEVACWIRKGMSGKILVNGKEFDAEMPANKLLSNVEITNIVNYIQNAWGNSRSFITLDEINKALKKCSE